ncbi:hypothetical protein OAT77_05455 [Alphaproteobacteria bacterium]|nr:hypothetical protein [Alphaproteobacteria bacterium]
MLNVDRTLSTALAHKKSGQATEAAKKYLKVLEIFPENPRAKRGMQRLSMEPKKREDGPIEGLLQELIEFHNKGDFAFREYLSF